MSQEAALENPAIFGGMPTSRASQLRLTREYAELARRHPPRSLSVVKAHLFKLLFMALDEHKELRDRLGSATDIDQLWLVAEARARGRA